MIGSHEYFDGIMQEGYDTKEYLIIHNEIVDDLVKKSKDIYSMIKQYDDLTDEYAEFILDIAHRLTRRRLNGE